MWSRPVNGILSVIAVLAMAWMTIGDVGGASATADVGTAHRGAPIRKSGWWRFSNDTASGNEQYLCVSGATEAVFSAFDQITQERLIGTACSKADFRQAASAWEFETVCDTGIPASMGGGIATSQGTITGDLHSNYVIHMTYAQAGHVGHGSITAKWTGMCPAERKAGDLQVAPDTVVNILEK
jgi:hypothetical protein